MRILSLVMALLLATACQTVTITREGTSKRSTPPDHTQRLPFYLFGIVGEHTIDARGVCNGKQVQQMQTKYYFLDGFLQAITIGIYSPRVVHVWCDERSKA